MSKLLLASVSLTALGIAIVLFEELVANNHANFHPCSPGLICDYLVAQDQFSIGIIPVIAGVIILGFSRFLSRTKSTSNVNIRSID